MIKVLTTSAMLALLISYSVNGQSIAVPGKISSENDEYCNVELKGKLKIESVGDEKVSRATVDVNGITFVLLSPNARPISDLDKRLNGRTVRVVGQLNVEQSKVEQRRLACVVEALNEAKPMSNVDQLDIVAQLKKSGEALVGYKAGNLEAASKACEQVGLEVVKTHGVGRFIVCRLSSETDVKGALHQLNKESAITYVLPNLVVRVQPPKPPKR